LHQPQEGVFHKAAAGEGGQPARFVDGQQMGVFKQDFEVLGRVWFDPGRTVPDKGWPKRDRFASGGRDAVDGDFAVVQIFVARLVGLSVGKGLPSGRAGSSMIFAADDCGIRHSPG